MMSTKIGILNETSLHASLKQLYARPGDLVESVVGESIIDIVRDGILIEIQTSNFSALKTKLDKHIDQFPIRIIYPIAIRRWINRIDESGELIIKRKSPKKGRTEELFFELIRIVKYLKHPHLSLEVVLLEDEVTIRNDGRGSWHRKGWSISDRRLVRVIGKKIYSSPIDYYTLLPENLDETFTTLELSLKSGIRKNLAGKMLYCMRAMDVIQVVGKRGNSYLYVRNIKLLDLRQ